MWRSHRLPSGVVACVVWLAVTACGGVDRNGTGSPSGATAFPDASAPVIGRERGACYDDGTCDRGLTCASDLCVKLPGSGGASGAGGERSDGGANGSGGRGGASGAGGGAPSATGGASAGGHAGSYAGTGGRLTDASAETGGLDGGTDARPLGVCVPGTRQCNAVQPELCDSRGTWQPNGAPCRAACSQGACLASGCLPGQRQCQGNVPHYCDANENWLPAAPCPFACVAGTCTGICVPGTTQCNGNAVERCYVSGQWAPGVPCVDQDCQDGVCF